MKLKNYIWMALGSMLFAACQNDTLQDELLSADSGIYTLSGKVEGGTAMSRAQIELGNNSTTESFMWNEGDAFTIYQSSNNEQKESVFRIDPAYSESGSTDKKTASFSTDTPALACVDYVAFYPAGIEKIDNQYLSLEIQRSLDFTGVTDYNEVWSQYLKDNMYMTAEGVLQPDTENSVHFQHLTSMFRITYTNLTDEEVTIDAVRLSGTGYRYKRNYWLGENQGWTGSTLTSYYEVATQGLKVLAGESTDFYILFMPYTRELTENQLIPISFKCSGEYKTIDVRASDIIAANNGATLFEAGKRYWFKITERETGLMWSKDFTTEVVTIPNPELSVALQRELGENIVTLNEEGLAVMSLMDVRAIKELNFGWKGYTITSLNGIEIFENLQYLYCANTQLTSCDLSQNTQLRHVDVSNNNLASVDITNLGNLEHFACNGNFDLKSLSLDGCSSIIRLYVQHTSLSTIEVPNPENMNLIYIGGNSNFQIDLNQFPNLRMLGLMDMGLTSLDIPTAIKPNLTSLAIDGNQFTALDLSEYPKLESLACSSNELTDLDLSVVPNLYELNCQNNRISTLDITALNNLRWLWIGYQKDNEILILKATDTQKEQWNNEWKNSGANERVYLEGEYSTKEITIKNKELSLALYKVLGPQKVTLDDIGCAVMKEGDMHVITDLDFGWNNYTITSFAGIENFVNLTYLNCNRSGLTECDLSQNTKLQHVSLRYNELTEFVLDNHSELRYLDCGGNNNLTTLDVVNCSSLEQIYFSQTALTSVTFPDQGRIIGLGYGNTNMGFDLNYFPNLKILQVYDSGLTSLDFIPTQIKNQLIELDCSANQITSLNLKEYPNLETLSCSYNNLEKLNVAASSKLYNLNCNDNFIKELDITNLKKLNWLYCGNQKNNINMVLTLTEAQKEWWNNNLKDDYSNSRVYFKGEEPAEIPEGNGSLDNFGNGGEF